MDDIYSLNPDYIKETQHIWIDYLNPEVDAPVFMNIFNNELLDKDEKEEEYFSRLIQNRKSMF